MASRGSICCRKNARCSVSAAASPRGACLFVILRCMHTGQHDTRLMEPQRGSRVQSPRRSDSRPLVRAGRRTRTSHTILSFSRRLVFSIIYSLGSAAAIHTHTCPSMPTGTRHPFVVRFFWSFWSPALLLKASRRGVLYSSRSPSVRIRLLHGKLGGKGRHRRVVRAAALGRRALRLGLGHRHGRLHPHSRGR